METATKQQKFIFVPDSVAVTKYGFPYNLKNWKSIKKNQMYLNIFLIYIIGKAIIDDDVTKRFTTEELTVWNLLSRTNQQYEYVSFRVTILWLVGFILRYCFLFPFR